ncbi:hypothetical protein [Duncaniella freteri]|uniref:hypothetical protein n=1 Tax=Duncaniella freteri TaxID=2530391 RepID=UPI0032B17C23
MSLTKNTSYESALFGLWLNWVIAGGVLFIPNLVSVYAPPQLIPIITYALAGALFIYNKSSLRSRKAVCPLLPTIAMRTLFMSATIMVIISIIYRRGLITYFYDQNTINSAKPFVTSLIISPVVFVNTLWESLRGKKDSACHTCFITLGSSTERGFLGKLFVQESRYQRLFLLAIATVLTIVTWGYYTFFYINVNINIPDRFFFGWVPVILFLVSIFYIGARCFTIWAYNFQDTEGSYNRLDGSSSLRILIISGDTMFLSRQDDISDSDDDDNYYDTPASLAMHFTEKLSKQKAARLLCDISKLNESDFELRFMYASSEASGERNTFHYICCPNSSDVLEESGFKGKWYNLSQIERMLHNRELTPMLAAEIHRLYTVTMAWKTYDADGNRLYKVKNYHPLFRLNGICDWDVDFNSPLWLEVSRFNEDKPLFRFRRMLRRIFDDR